MTLNEYQAFASQGIHSATLEREPIVGFALGLAGEAGEVIDDIKKRVFHGRKVPLEHTKEELGDVLWYVANIATEYHFSLEDILEANVFKLRLRYPDKYNVKEDAKHAEFDSEDCATGTDCSDEGPEHIRDRLPWD